MLASARIPKFGWKNGENFHFEMWYLNDSTENVSDTVKASVKIGNREFELLTWKTGNVAACENKLGPACNFTLPAASGERDITLILSASDGCSSTYKLSYTCTEKEAPSFRMNV